MRRFTRSRRSSRNITDTNALRDQFMRQLAQEADALLKQLTDQFSQTLQTQVTQSVRGIIGNGSDIQSPGSDAPGEFNTINSVGQLLATGARYLATRPRTTRDTQESSRSIDADSRFKLSQTQAAMEAQAMLGNGDKNA